MGVHEYVEATFPQLESVNNEVEKPLIGYYSDFCKIASGTLTNQFISFNIHNLEVSTFVQTLFYFTGKSPH